MPRLLCVVVLLLLPWARAAAAAPNVALIVVDDFRPDCIAALGHPHVKTPNLDKLVKAGFSVSNAYCLGSDRPAVCTPSRNMILSGQTYFRRWKDGLAPGTGPNLAATFKAAGYYTYHHGKRGNVARLLNAQFDKNLLLADDQKERSTGHPGKTITDAAVEFLKTRKGEQPFLMCLEYEAPHDPRVAAPEYLALYERDKLDLPKNFLPQHPFNNGAMLIRDERLAAWPRTPAEIRKHLHDYYAVITAVDRQIGRLLQTLDELKLTENTVIVFVGDSGLALGSHGLMGKQNLYDHTMRAPLIVSGPGVAKGSSPALVYLLDIFPTLCDLTGVKAPADLDGKSFAGVVQGKVKAARPSLFLAYEDSQRAVRDERWKLLRYPQVNVTQLFDLQNDPDELRDLSKEQPRQVERLTEMLAEWRTRLNDKAPLTIPQPLDPKFTPPANPK